MNPHARAMPKHLATLRQTLGRWRRAYRLTQDSDFELLEWSIRHLRSLGEKRSFDEQRPVDTNGEPLPWMTYPAIEYLKQLDLTDKFIFEYGCGFGSLYWAKRARRVVSVEDNAAWAAEIRPKLRANQEIILASTQNEYVDSIGDCGEVPDIIIVDGIHRKACAEVASRIAPVTGIIVVDNSDWYLGACAVLADHGFFRFDFIGAGPINAYAWATSVFVKTNGGIGIRFKNVIPAVNGGLHHVVND